MLVQFDLFLLGLVLFIVLISLVLEQLNIEEVKY